MKPGDLIVWEATAEGTAAEPLDLQYLRAIESTLSEWSSLADEDAYREL